MEEGEVRKDITDLKYDLGRKREKSEGAPRS